MCDHCNRNFGAWFRLSCFFALLALTQFSALAQSGRALDDTIGDVNLNPDTVEQLVCQQFCVEVDLSLTDARVFSLRFSFNPGILQLNSVLPSFEPSLHILPFNLSGNIITVDGYFHPNFSGTTTALRFCFTSLPLPDTITTINWVTGQGYSGTYDAPIPITFSGDTTVVILEGTPPLAPDSVVIRRLAVPAFNDSIEVIWTPVVADLLGDTVISPLYVVYREDVINAPGLFDSIGTTTDTFFYETFIQINFNPPYDSLVVNNANFLVKSRKTAP